MADRRLTTDDRPHLPEFSIKVVTSLKAIPPPAWNGCAQPAPAGAPAQDSDRPETYNPFVAHEFLSALEDSGSVGGRTGWMPAHVLVESHHGQLIGAAPSYIKSHSQGEYVFDHGWAE